MKKLKPQEADFEHIKRFIAGAEKKLSAAKKNLAIDEEAAYELAYEAMLKASLGLMLSFGLRPRSLPGHHVAIIEFVAGKLGKEHDAQVSMFDHMRRKRHQAVYDVVGFVSMHEAEEAVASAERYVAVIRDEIGKHDPQARLF